MDALHKDFSPHIARQSLVKKPVDIFNHQEDTESPSDTSEHGRQFGHNGRDKGMAYSLSNARTNPEEDTSLDHYIPCFVKKIKGMKPFLIDMKPAPPFARRKINNSYDKQYKRSNEGTSSNFTEPYSTMPAPDCGNFSYGTSWSVDLQNKDICPGPHQACQISPLSHRPVCGPNHGNHATKNKINNYNAAHNHHWAENYMRRSSSTSYQLTSPTINYKNTHQSSKNSELTIRGLRRGKGKTAVPDDYNRKDFAVNYRKARFFMIKSYSENDVFNSMKYNVWSSTPHGNKKLDLMYRDAQVNHEGDGAKCPIFLFFSVNSSRQFVGLAEMVGSVDFKKDMDFWLQDRWSGFFPLKWHIVKDIPNYKFRDIILENNENKVVTFSQDTQEIPLRQGLKMLRIFKEYQQETSLLDDFEVYEEQQREKLTKKHGSLQCSDAELMERVELEMRKLSFTGQQRF